MVKPADTPQDVWDEFLAELDSDLFTEDEQTDWKLYTHEGVSDDTLAAALATVRKTKAERAKARGKK